MWKNDSSDTPQTPVQPREHGGVAKSVQGPSSDLGTDGLGQSVEIIGDLSGSEDLTIHGRVDGRISVPDHMLMVGAQADVKANIAAKVVIVLGKITGTVAARDRIEIRATGQITGNISSPSLVVADGGYLSGRVETTRDRIAPVTLALT